MRVLSGQVWGYSLVRNGGSLVRFGGTMVR